MFRILARGASKASSTLRKRGLIASCGNAASPQRGFVRSAPNTWLQHIPAVENPYAPEETRNRMLPERAQSYEEIVQQFKFPSPKTFNIGADITDKHAHTRWDQPAIIFVDEVGKEHKVTFGEMIIKSNQIANALVESCNMKFGDRAAILMSQSPETAMLHAGIMKAGYVSVPLFTLFGPEALSYRIQDSGSKVIFVEPSKLDELLAMVEDLPQLETIVVTSPMSSFDTASLDSVHGQRIGRARVTSMQRFIASASPVFTPVLTSPDDPALIIYTSGTTGPPKGALHAHRTLLGHLPGVEFPQGLFPQQNDLFWTPADWAWIGGLIDVLLPSLHHGVPVLAYRMRKFDPELTFSILGKYKVRNAFMPPTALKMMREVSNPRGRFNYSMRSIGCGGETLGESVLEWGKETFGFYVNEFYGQTECNLVLGNCSQLMGVRPGSMGKPIPGHTVEICDSQGNILPQGETGIISVKAPHPVMFLKYLNKPEATRDKFANGFLLTGDIGRKDKDGYFWYVGRNDDVIKSAGYRIGPSEIEECLIAHQGVTNAAAVGIPDELRNEAVKCFVVLAPMYKGASEGILNNLRAELMEHVKRRLAKHEYPRQIEFVDELPMTTTGKVIRKELKKREYEKYYAALGKPCPEI